MTWRPTGRGLGCRTVSLSNHIHYTKGKGQFIHNENVYLIAYYVLTRIFFIYFSRYPNTTSVMNTDHYMIQLIFKEIKWQ
ncbi:hypothetical protein SAMN05421882_103032 [Nitrosomonas communis]|uniref:Uncharacterized protein n=1 Tax=Nitrosomonas communis TaxID=44574 RepID=A0A1H2WPC6_9PROT|nr:hypothetical protein SAMN05421882_103032 [Nitrosomonas communis]